MSVGVSVISVLIQVCPLGEEGEGEGEEGERGKETRLSLPHSFP